MAERGFIMADSTKTRTALDNAVRVAQVAKITDLLVGAGEEVLQVGGNVIAFPSKDDEGNEVWLEITVKVPKGERIPEGGYAGYDGYALAEFYADDQKEKIAKADAAAKKKAADIAKKAKKEVKTE